MLAPVPRSVAPLLLLALLCGCSSSDHAPSSLQDVQAVAVSARNIRISWTPQDGAEVVIQRSVPGSPAFIEVARKQSTHGRFLDLGLDPETPYAYKLTLCRDDVCETPFSTGAIATPPTEFPSVELTVAATGTADDLVIFGTYRLSATVFKEGHMVAVDRTGKIVWEYATHEWGPITEVQPLADGTLVTGQFQTLVQVDLDGREVYRWTGTDAHHDIDELADGRLGFISADPFESEPGYTRMGDAIRILNHERTAIEWEWRARDHIVLSDANELDLQDNLLGLGHDWTHANALTFNADASKVIVNLRNLNRIYQIDVATKQTDWIMGEGGDFGAGIWDHSHDPEFLDEHHVLIMDNGMRRPEPQFSRVIEVEFDPAAKTSAVVWEYRETPDFYNFALGSVHRQDNGNVFITDGTNGRLLEVTREKQKVWELKVEKYFWVYKAVTVPREFFTAW